MTNRSDISYELGKLVRRAGGIADLSSAIDAEFEREFPTLWTLAYRRSRSHRAAALAEMIADAVPGLREDWQAIAPMYLGLADVEHAAHKVRQFRAARDLGIKRRGRAFSTSNFRQHLAPQLLEAVATELARLDAEQPARPRRHPHSVISDWPLGDRPQEGQPVVLLAATPNMREGPRSALVTFVREFEPYLRSGAIKPMICAVDGSYAAILRSGLLHDHQSLVRLGAGVEGGLVYGTEIVLNADVERNPLTVVYLIDPRDPSARYPIVDALRKACVAREVPILTSLASARRWFRLQWAIHTLDARPAPGPIDQHLLLSTASANVVNLGPDRREQGVALAAHDRRKYALLEFAGDHQEFLSSNFDARFATRMTGSLLNGESINGSEMSDFGRHGMDPDERLSEVRKIADWQKAHRLGDDWATLVTQGRHGGVVQLARRVLDKQVTTCIFLEDLATPRETDTELQVLDRVSQIPAVDCLTLLDSRTANAWANANRRIRERSQKVSSTTLVEVFKERFGVDLVLAHDLRGEAKDPQLWDLIVSCASTYLLEAVISAARHHDRLAPATVGVSWGGALRNVIDGLIPALNVRAYVSTAMRRQTGPLVRHTEWTAADRSIAIGGAIAPQDLTVVPMVGIMGTKHRDAESNALVASVAENLGGTALTHPEYAFVHNGQNGGSSEPSAARAAIQDAWKHLDIALCGCDAIQTDLSKDLVGFPGELHRKLKQIRAGGEFGHIYLTRQGEEIQLQETGYTSTGIPTGDLRARVNAGADVILVAGAQADRELPAWTALHAGLVSTFITNTRFAWNVLCYEFPRRLSPIRD